MRSHLTSVLFLVVLGLTLFSGVLQGRLSNRWGIKPDMAAAAKQLKVTPTRFGDWELTQAITLDAEIAKMLESAAYLGGIYRNKVSGESINMFVLLGPPGPVSVHTPDICYSSRDFAIIREREQVAVRDATGANAELWALTLRGNDLDANLLRVYYGWNDGGGWTAPDNPRFDYAGRPLLYKIQVAGNAAGEAAAKPDDLGQRFLRDFLPVLQPQLAPAASGERRDVPPAR